MWTCFGAIEHFFNRLSYHSCPIVFYVSYEEDQGCASVLRLVLFFIFLCMTLPLFLCEQPANPSWPQSLKTVAQADSLRYMKPRAASRPSNGDRVSTCAVAGINVQASFFSAHTDAHNHICCLSSKTLAYIYRLVWSWSPNRILIFNDLLNVFLISFPSTSRMCFFLFTFGLKP